MIDAPEVDAVIAVHAPTRPIERAVGSILEHTRAEVRVTVVIHNTDPAPIRGRLAPYAADPRLRIEEFVDGIPSPAGPMNRGFDMATAPYVTLLGSDDAYDPGAIDSWLSAAHTRGARADAVIAPLRLGAGSGQSSPPIRWTRALRTSALLHPVRDRLAYRTAPLGLIGRARFGSLRFAEGVQTGEDQPFTAAMWFTPGARIVFPVRGPGYRGYADESDRVTFAPRPIEAEFEVLDLLLDRETVWMRNASARLALLAKVLRVHVFDAAATRIASGQWSRGSAEGLAAIARRVLAAEPRIPRILSRHEEDLLRGLLDAATPASLLEPLLAARTRLRSPGALVPRRWVYLLHSQAPLRRHLAGVVLRRLSSR